MRRNRVLRAGGVALLALSLVAPGAAAADAETPAPDLTIVSGARQLSADEVRAHDITDTDRGARTLRDAASDGTVDINRRPYRVFEFEGQRMVIDAKTPVAATVGVNAVGKTVYDLVPTAKPVASTARPGYAIPPATAWTYNTDGSSVTFVGTWKQSFFWTITAAWNYKTCSSCTAYQYFRIYGKLIAQVLTGSKADEGFRKAWVEFDNNGAWGGNPIEFEPPTPEESYAGANNTTRSWGYGQTFNLSFNIAPLTIGGSANNTYGGSMSSSSENWHPVARTEIASGGVMWCYYNIFNEFGGTKSIATQVGIRQAVNAQLGGWNFLKGMRDDNYNCPSQI
ncbi:MAG TPA: hypothetical protein VJ850_02380 [Candidatus Limnocylindrales bacterium]|nr:hypothetical protein [Candidatus Limnocylindrales bacterium]